MNSVNASPRTSETVAFDGTAFGTADFLARAAASYRALSK